MHIKRTVGTITPSNNFPKISKFRLLYFVFCLFTVFLSVVSFGISFNNAQADEYIEKQKIELKQAVINALVTQPEIQAESALLCQAIFEIGLIKAQNKPQITAQIVGQSQFVSNFDSSINDEDNAQSRGLGDEEDGIFDMRLSVSKTLWDWNRYEYSITSKELSHISKQYKRKVALSNKLKELMQLSLDYQFTKNSLAIGLEVQEQISDFMTSIEAKGEAGVIPLINVRRAKLLSIDFEGQVEKTKNQLDRIEKEITTSFSLIPSDIVHFPQLFEQHRPIELPFFNENTSIAVASLGFEISAMMNENQAISLENKPIVYGTVTSSVFDLRDFEEEYEIIGELSVSMPLYDGGSNLARQNILNWQISGLNAEKDRIVQLSINRQTTNFSYLNQSKVALLQADEERKSMQEQLDNMLAVSGNVAISELSIMEQMVKLSQVRVKQLIGNRDINQIFADQLDLADSLLPLFTISSGIKEC